MAQKIKQAKVLGKKIFDFVICTMGTEVLVPWFEKMACDIQPFIKLDKDGNLLQEKNQLFYSIYGNTKIPELFERALRLKGMSVVIPTYLETLVELADALYDQGYGKLPSGLTIRGT